MGRVQLASTVVISARGARMLWQATNESGPYCGNSLYLAAALPPGTCVAADDHPPHARPPTSYPGRLSSAGPAATEGVARPVGAAAAKNARPPSVGEVIRRYGASLLSNLGHRLSAELRGSVQLLSIVHAPRLASRDMDPLFAGSMHDRNLYV